MQWLSHQLWEKPSPQWKQRPHVEISGGGNTVRHTHTHSCWPNQHHTGRFWCREFHNFVRFNQGRLKPSSTPKSQKLRRNRTFFSWHVKLTAHYWQYRTVNKCVSQVSTTSMRCSLQFHLHVYTGLPIATQQHTLSVVYSAYVPLLHETRRSLTWVTVCKMFWFMNVFFSCFMVNL